MTPNRYLAAAAIALAMLVGIPGVSYAQRDGFQSDVTAADKDVADLNCEQLWLARNRLFKEAGYCFKTPRAIAAFGNAGCLYDDVSAVHLPAEKRSFVEAILRAERLKACPK
jgi:YARHG domain